VLPVIGVALMVQRLGRSTAKKAWRWSDGRNERRAVLAAGVAALAALLAWAWWPAGQYQPVRASDHGTLLSAFRTVAAPASVVRPEAGAAPVSLSSGRHLAVALIPHGGATKDHPAIFVIKGRDGSKPAVVVSGSAPSTSSAPALKPGATPAPSATPPASAPAPATVFPFKLPAKPGPHESQALATNSTDGAIKYDVVYSLVTVKDGAPVDEKNSAYALASCKACMTVAVSFQLVLVVGQSDKIMPINVAEALNNNCPSCITTAIADQIVVSLKAAPPEALIRALTAELSKLGAIKELGAGGTPAAVAAAVAAVQTEIEKELRNSGLTYPTPTPTPVASATPSPTASPTATATPDASASPTDTPTPTPTDTATPSPTDTATPSATP
jgi:putative peptide zinc metalloprotease protein